MMEIKGIKELLDRYRSILSKEEGRRDEILKIMNDVARASITERDITIKGGVLTIKAISAKKNKIFLYKERILSEFTASKIEITDIR